MTTLYYESGDKNQNELYHHGIKGMKWGIRRYQNPDGSLTPAGRKHYGYGNGESGGAKTETKKSRFSRKSDAPKSKSSSKGSSDTSKSKSSSSKGQQYVESKTGRSGGSSNKNTNPKNDSSGKGQLGVIKGSGKNGAMNPNDVAKLNAEILKGNPNAAVADFSILEKKSDNRGLKVGAAAAAAAVGVAALRNKNVRKLVQKYGDLDTATSAIKRLKDIGEDAVTANKTNAIKNFTATKMDDLAKTVGMDTKAVTKTFIKDKDVTDEVMRKYLDKGFNVNTEANEKALNLIGNWLHHDAHRYDEISKVVYDKMDDTDLVLKTGQTFKRVSKDAEKTLWEGAYVSFDDDDFNRYKAFLPTMWKTKGFNMDYTNVYTIEMKAVSEIKSPSAKKRIDIFEELLRENPEWLTNPGEQHALKTKPNKYAPQYARKYYNTIASSLCNRSNEITQKYFERVKQHGYNAIIDDNDAGRLSRNPLILLDPSSIEMGATNQLSNKDIQQAFRSIVPMNGETIDAVDGHNWQYKALLSEYYGSALYYTDWV